MTPTQSEAGLDPMKGIGLTTLGYAFFSVQDAVVKWLVVKTSVPQILFTRSLVIIVIATLIGGRQGFVSLARTQKKAALLARAALILGAWLSYYTASRFLGLAELTTIYFASPVIVVVLSVLILKEAVGLARWLAVLVGFGGVVLAASPGVALDAGPAGLAFLGACCWGGSVILARLINRSETTTNQMLVSNALFAAVCAVLLFWTWRTPDAFSLCLMLGLGIAGGMGQFFLYEGFRYAPASVVAPIEYTGLVWAFFYGYVIWADVPPVRVFVGALLIVCSSLAFIGYERARTLRQIGLARGAAK